MKNWKCWRDASHAVELHPMFGWPRCTACQAAPPYHERPGYLPDDFVVNVYIPIKTPIFLKPASAVVGLPVGDEHVLAHYEGWKYGQYADLDPRDRWEAGLLHAADRMVTHYPTTATAYFRVETLKEIGTYNPRTRQVHIEDESALSTWLGIQTSVQDACS